jgi:hypothetical protein
MMSAPNSLEEKLAEVIGLAQAAGQATARVSESVGKGGLRALLGRLHEESTEIAQRSIEVGKGRGGDARHLFETAAKTREQAIEEMSGCFAGDAGRLNGFEFLVLSKAREADSWSTLGRLSGKAGESAVGRLVDWALPLQEAQLGDLRDASLELASDEEQSSG